MPDALLLQPTAPKNAHFNEKDDSLKSVRIFRRTGKLVSVSKPAFGHRDGD
jgi:hypothetical protein